jgi:O-antigen/teichoic acid export membrane protein
LSRTAFSRVAATLRDSILVRRSSVMLGGVVAAKITTVLSLLVLARLYGAEAFGLLGLFQALVLIVSVVAMLGYAPAIALPERREAAASVLWLSLLLLGATAGLAWAATIVLGEPLARWLDAPALGPLLHFAPLYLFAFGIYEVLSHWSTRRRAFRRLAASTVVVAASVAAFQIAAFLAGAEAGGLVLGTVLGTTLAAAILALQSWTSDRTALAAGRTRAGMRAAAAEHRQFPAYQAPAALVVAASAALIPLGLGYFFGAAVVGLFWLADRVCGYLTNLVRQALQQVFLNRAAEVANAGGDVARLFRRTTLGLLGLSLPTTAILVVAGPPVFGLLFGAEWVAAGSFARWLAIAWLWGLLNIPAVQLAAVYRRQRWTLVYSLGLAAFRAAAIGVGGVTGDPVLVMVVHAAGNTVCSLILILVVDHYIRHRPRLAHPTVRIHAPVEE